MRDLIHFAHGNGFPSPCYGQLLKALQRRYDTCYIDRIGHHPHFPVTENWHFLVDELIASIKEQAVSPVIAVGHSLGGVLSLLAAIEQPSLFKAVIMLDSPLPGRFKSRVIRLAKALGLIDKITPAYRTRGRREYWQNKEQLLDYLQTRDLFKTFSKECLLDYVNYGLKKTTKGYELRFDRQVEYQIYKTIPHELADYERKLTIPAALIYGDKSTVVDKFDRRNMKKNYNINAYKIKGTHMFPMEHPTEVADKIFNVLDAIIK